MNSFIKINLFSVFAILSACGGGGGGDSSSSGGSSSGTSGISYTGLEAAAVIDETNAPEIASTIITGSTSGGAVTVVGVETSNAAPPYAGATEVISSYLNGIDPFVLSQNILGVEVSETESCSNGGSVSLEGDVNENNGDFTLEFDFNNCNEAGIVLDGTMDTTGSLDLVTEDFDEPFEASFDNLSYDDGDFQFAMGGTIECTFNEYPDENDDTVFQDGAYWCNQNIVYEDANLGDVFWLRDLALIVIPFLEGVDTVYAVEVFGRFYHPDYGYVDINGGTDAPNSAMFAIYDDSVSIYPVAGVGILDGNNSSVQLTFNADGLTYLLEIDSDGDGTYESSSTQNW